MPEVWTARSPRRIVLDLGGLDFIDVLGVRLALEVDARIRANGHRLSLVRGPERVHRVFALAGVVDALPFG